MALVGVHCPVEKTLMTVVSWTKGVHANIAQFFLQNPHTYSPRIVNKKEWGEFFSHLKQEKISPLFVHAPYVVNLCALDESVREKSIGVITHLLQQIEGKENMYLVTHIGYHGGTGFEEGLHRFGDTIRKISNKVSVEKLLIENASGQTNSMGSSLDELTVLLDEFPEISLCIDTAHLWGFGYSPGDRVLLEFLLRWKTAKVLKLIHLNNSRDELSSKKDHHAKLNEGKIPAAELKAFALTFRDIPMILETPKNTLEEDKEQIRIIREWLGANP